MTFRFDPFDAVLLDMNGTFMFGEDRFGADEDFWEHYAGIGGVLDRETVNRVVRDCYDYLDALYVDPNYQDRFPTVRQALADLVSSRRLESAERDKIEMAFAHHELGTISVDHARFVRRLAMSHPVGIVADIWSEKSPWMDVLRQSNLLDVIGAAIFSSDIGSVKPSARPFVLAAAQLGVPVAGCIMIGDSLRRDIAGAFGAGMQSIWIGDGERPASSLAAVPSLFDIEF